MKQHEFVQDLKQRQLEQEQKHQKITDMLRADITNIQTLFSERPSRKEDLEKISFYKEKYQETEGVITQLKLEMHNREETYNKRMRGKFYVDDLNQLDNDSPTAIIDLGSDMQQRLATDISTDTHLNNAGSTINYNISMSKSYQSDFFKQSPQVIIRNDTIKLKPRCSTSSKKQRCRPQNSSLNANQYQSQKLTLPPNNSGSCVRHPTIQRSMNLKNHSLMDNTSSAIIKNAQSFENSQAGFFNYLYSKKFGIRSNINKKSQKYIQELNQSYCN